MASADLLYELRCSICLSLYSDPVLLKCGHNFCEICIVRVLDEREGSGIYSCPECRAEYRERPELKKNKKLGNIVKHFMPRLPEQEEAKDFCTYCCSPTPATKTCLQCETSLCNKHLRNHNVSVDHVLMDPTMSLLNMTCSFHKKGLKYYCPEDGAHICVKCFDFGEHRGHLLETIVEASEKKKKKLRHLLDILTSKRGETEKRVLSLQEHMEGVQEEAAGVIMTVTGLFSNIREELETTEIRLLDEITRQTNQMSLNIHDLIQQLKIKKEAQSQTIGHIENLSNPISVLQGQELEITGGCDTIDGGDHEGREAIGVLNKGLFMETLHKAMSDIVTSIPQNIISMHQVFPIILDLNTAHNKLEVSADLKTVSASDINHGRPDSESRFTIYNQILSVNGFTQGHHYWEVETSFQGMWDIGLAYPSIQRDGKCSGIGDNSKSWCLRKYIKKYMWAHNSKAQSLIFGQCSQIIGIYLDYGAGRLSFYELCHPDEPIYRLLHTFSATFTEPLHTAIYVDDGAWVRVMR